MTGSPADMLLFPPPLADPGISSAQEDLEGNAQAWPSGALA